MASDYERQSRDDRREAERPDDGPKGAAQFKALQGPVGIRGGKQVANRIGDQTALMDMFDKLRTDFGGNRNPDGTLEIWWPLPIEGQCNLTLWSVILRVQNYFYMNGGTKQPPGDLGFVPDGVVDPGGRTQYLITFFGGSNLPPMPAGTNPKELAKAAIPTALRWANGATAYLQKYKAWRSARRSFPFDDGAANTHLHLDRLNDADSIARVGEWLENYRLIIGAFNNSDRVFVRATREEALAARNNMNCWGQEIPAWASANANMWFGPDMIGLGPNCKSAILLHEGGHYIKAKIGHQGGERGNAYDTQSADQALTSAYVCANFATHATTGRDERFGLARPKE